MKLKLYIDFDGVILNTIDISYKILDSMNIDITSSKVSEFYSNLDWGELIEKSSPINHSIDNLIRLSDSGLYDVEILTHVYSDLECQLKEEYLRKYIPDIKFVFVNKKDRKCDVVDCRNAILVDDYIGNLDSWKEKGGIPVKFSTTGKKYDYIAISSLDMLLDKYDMFLGLMKEKSYKSRKRT